MKSCAKIFVIAGLVLVLAAQAAVARIPFSRKASRRDGQVESPLRCSRLPTMEFVAGTLNRDSGNGWVLDGLPLRLVGDCRVDVDGSPESGALQSGQPALVMGHRQGGVLAAYRVRILRPCYAATTVDQGDLEFQRSESDPTVGVGRGPN